MTTIISSKTAKFAAGLVGLVAGVAMFAITAQAATFTTNLKQGSTGADVKNLQILLNMSPDTKVSVSGAGSPGNETSTFGPATKRAVIKFQNKYASETLAPAGLTAGTGFVGALTRAKLNAMGGSVTTTTTTSGTTTTTTVQSGPISVSLANDNPSASAVVAGQATADLMHVTFTGNGTLSTVKLQRTGISSNNTLTNVYLFQGNARVSDGASVDSNGVITFNNLGIAVNGSLTLSVRADILSTATGQIVGVTLTGYTAAGNSASTASISGNFMSVATATLAGVTLSGTQAAAANVNAGTMAYTLWSQSASVTSRAVLLKGATFKYIGSATADALANIKLYVNGVAVGTAGTINAATNLLAFDFGSAPVTLNTGASTIEVRADIVKGSSRNVSITLQNSGDLLVTDSQLGVNVALSSFAASPGGTMSINSGSVSTSVDTSFTSLTTVTGGSTGAVIGRFKLQAYGEDVKVSSLSVTPLLTSMSTSSVNTTLTTGGTDSINNVAIYWNGAQVGSVSATNVTGTAIVYSLGSSLIVPAGSSGILEVRGDMQNTAGSNYTAGTVVTRLNIGTNYGQGQTSSTLVDVPTAVVSTTGLTVATGALSIAQSAGYASAQIVNPNTANVKLGSYVMQNTSTSESVRFTNLLVAVTTSGSVTNLSNLRTSETSGSGSTPISPALGSNNFSVNFTLAPGQSKTIDVMTDLGSATTSSTYTTTLLPTAVGASSNVTLTPSSAIQGQTLTVLAGSVSGAPTLNPAPASLAAQFVVGGSQNLNVAQYNFVATNGVATISELKFLVGGYAANPVTQICVSGVCAPVVNNIAYLTGLALSVPNSSAGLNVQATASFAPVGVNGVTSNQPVILNLTYMKYSIGGVTTSTNTGTFQLLGTFSSTSGFSSGATLLGSGTVTLSASSTNPWKVGTIITATSSSTYTATTTSTSTVGYGVVTAVTSDLVATVNFTTAIATSSGMFLWSTSTPSNTLTVVGTKPTVTIAGSTDTLSNSLVKIAEITVTADAGGDLKVTAIPVNTTATGGGGLGLASTTSSYIVKGTDGTTIASSNTAAAMGSDVVITLTGGFLIPAGTSKTFRIYDTASGVAGTAGTMSLSTKLGAAASFLWNDMVGGVNGILGSLIYNYPTDTSVIKN